MPKYKKKSSIQNNTIDTSDQNSSVSTFSNQHSIQGIHGNTVQGLSGGAYVTDKNLLQIQNNTIDTSNQNSSVSTFSNQHSIQGKHKNNIQGLSGGAYVTDKNLLQIQNNQIPLSNIDSSVASFENQTSIQGLDKMNGGNCSMVNNIEVPCVQTPEINTPKCAPVLSQSELAFDSRYHTSNNSVIKAVQNQKAGSKVYQNKTQNGSGYHLDLNDRIGGLPNVQNVYDPKPPLYSPKYNIMEYDKTTQSYTQCGGAYNYIINPVSGRRVKLKGKLGKNILRNYLSYMNGGSEHSIFTDDMTKRTFGCTQPYWNANCV